MHVNPKRHNTGSGMRRPGAAEELRPAQTSWNGGLGRQGGASSLFEAPVCWSM